MTMDSDESSDDNLTFSPSKYAGTSSHELPKLTEDRDTFSDFDFSVDDSISVSTAADLSAAADLYDQDDANESKEPVSSDSVSDDNDVGMAEHLRDWAIQHKITHTAVNALLQVMHADHSDLPLDARTLLKTPTAITVKKVAGGSFYYFGVQDCLQAKLQLCCGPCEDYGCHIALKVNVDGLPLFKSSNGQLWPILGLCDETWLDEEPFVIGIFYGESKPSSADELMHDFVEEMLKLKTDGFLFKNNVFHVTVSAFICDAPARAFLKNVKLHSGYYGCERCTQRGAWFGKVVFPEVDALKRKDSDYHGLQNVVRNIDEVGYDDESTHVTGPCILNKLSVGLVSEFPLDYMHLCCLGVMRRILRILTKPTTGTSKKWKLAPGIIQSLSTMHVTMQAHTPREFSRKPRSLLDLERWKATELRFFMLYSGPVVLKTHVDARLYDNFMLFSLAMRILLSPTLCASHCDYAQILLLEFVQQFGKIYGQDGLVYNVHSCIHLCDDAKKFGCLEKISAFPFENFLGKLKRMCRKRSMPLQQIVRRILETREASASDKTTETAGLNNKPKKQHWNGPVPLGLEGLDQYKQIQCKNMYVSVLEGDNCFEYEGTPIQVVNILCKDELNVYIAFNKFLEARQPNLYSYPCDSKLFGIEWCLEWTGNWSSVQFLILARSM
jgi:hypothetical protein